MHNHQSALDSQIEENEINWLFPEPDNDEILERLYEEEVQESLDRLKKLGFKDIKESDLDTESIEKAVRKKFDELPEPSDYEMLSDFGTKWHDGL